MPLTEEQTVQTLLAARARLCAGLCLLVRDAHTAEDIFQTVTVRALRENFENEGHALAWARVTGRRLGLDLLKSKGAQWQPLDEALLSSIEQEWAERHAAPESVTMHALHECLAELPDRSRELLEMRYHEGRSGEEIAAHLACKAQAVYARLYRLHKMLRQCLEQRLAEEGAR